MLERVHNMLHIGECIYRFKFDTSGNLPVVTKHTFKVVEIEEADESKKFRYKFKCIEDPTCMFRDGLFTSIDQSYFNKAKSRGNFIYVTLRADDDYNAWIIVSNMVQAKLYKFQEQLKKVESSYKLLCNYGEVQYHL